MLVPFHNHSDASALDGTSQPIEIAARAKQIGSTACAISDHGVCTNHFEWKKAAKKFDIKPIYAMEAYHGDKWTGFQGNERDQPHLILIAKNDIGLQNLWTLSYLGALPDKFRYVPRVSWDDLKKHHEGIIATSACALGKVTQEMLHDSTESLSRYLDIFGDDFYLELSTYDCTKVFEDAGTTTKEINRGLVHLGQERGVGFFYGDDGHYAFPNQYEYHDAYVVSSTGRTRQGEEDQSIYTPIEERKMWHPQCLYIKDEADVRERLNYLPDSVVDEALQNTVDVAETIDADFPNVERHLPIFVPKDCPFPEAKVSDDAEELFVHLVMEGIKERYPACSNEVYERALREVEVFLDAGLHHYFLMAWDLNLFCDAEALPEQVQRWVPERTEPILRGPGRGSAAGCIVAYALAITDVDPLHYDLIFERFWNAGRAKGFPDIDSDFARKWRPVILKYLKKRHGEDRVFPIGTTARMKPKACIDKLRSAYAMTYDEAAELKDIMNGVENIEILGPDSIAWSRSTDPDLLYGGKARTIYVDEHVGEEILKWVQADRTRVERRARYVRACAHLTNRIASYGIHPSGILILDKSAIGQSPFALRGPEEDRRVVTEFNMDEIDSLMMIKLDILGLKTLDTLDAWEKLVGIPDWAWSGLDLSADYPEEMWELLDKKFTAGIFQVEQGLARQFLATFKARSVEELAIAGSIIRPGPNESMDSFLIRRFGGTDEEFDGRTVPLLKPILDPTYGWFLYQEQVIAFFSALGYDLGEADAVRKILGKKKPEDMEELLNGAGPWKVEVNSERASIQPIDNDGQPTGQAFMVTNRGYREVAYPQLGKDTADIIWAKLEHFARYSFNKSHSVCYAVIGFRCLLAKYYAPAEFYAASIATVDDSKRAQHIPMYIAEARRLNIKTHGPDILNSDSHVTVRDGDIYIGLSEVKGVKTGGEIVTLLREEGHDISTPEKLFDLLDEQSRQISKKKAAAKKAGVLYDGPVKSWKQQLNKAKIQALLDVGAWDSLGENPRSLAEKQKAEKEFLGVILTDESPQILARNWDEIQACDEYVDAEAGEIGEQFTLPGVVIDVRNVKARSNGKAMGIITAEFGGDTIEFATSPLSWKSHRFLWKDRACGLFTIKKSARGYNFESGSKLS